MVKCDQKIDKIILELCISQIIGNFHKEYYMEKHLKFMLEN